MARPSEPPTRHTRSLIFLVVIATGLVGLAIAGAGSAQGTIEDIQTYSWNSDSTGAPVWEPIPEATEQDSIEHEIPRQGFLLVELSYSDFVEPGQIDFSLLSWDDYSSEADSISSSDYRFIFNGDGSGHDDDVTSSNQNVYLAQDVEYDSGGDQIESTHNGCGEETGPPDLWNTGPRSCFFLIELDNENAGSSLSTGSHYILEVEIEGVTRLDNVDDESADPGSRDGERTVIPYGLDIGSPQVSFEPELVHGDVEAGVSMTAEIEVAIGESSSNRGTADTENGDPVWPLDGWVCLFDREATERAPYENFLTGSHDETEVWDEPAACEFKDDPTHHHEQESAVHAINLSTAEFDDSDGVWTFTHTFTIPREDVQTRTDRFVDRFDYHVILRDALGNLNLHDEPMDLARYDVDQTTLRFDSEESTNGYERTDNLDAFEDEERRCYELLEEDEPGEVEHVLCYRASNAIPTYDEAPFQFDILVENYGNHPDEVSVSTERLAGDDDWDVEIIHQGSTVTEGEDTVPIPAGDAQDSTGDSALTLASNGEPPSEVDPGQTVIQVHMTPPDTTAAQAEDASDDPETTLSEGWMQLKVTVESDNTVDESSGRPIVERTLEAVLVKNPRGTIDLGENGENEATLTLNATEQTDVPLTVTSTGNTLGPFQVVLDDIESDMKECLGVNPDSSEVDEEAIHLQLRDQTTGQPVDPEQIRPTRSSTYDLRVTIGEQVPIGTYECVFTFEGNPVLDSLTPTLTVNVEGQPNIRIWDVEGADHDQVDVTGDEIRLVVPPTEDIADVYIYLENIGDAALEPALEVDEVEDRYNLGGTWKAQTDGSTDPISLTAASQPFNLPPSDEDDTEHVLVRNLFKMDTREPENNKGFGEERWHCAEEDSPHSDSSDPRRVCQIHMLFDVTNRNPVIGDRVEYEFTWQDLDEVGIPATTNVILEFGYAGTVETTMVEDKAISDTGSSIVELEAFLNDGHRFDPDSTAVDASIICKDGTGTPPTTTSITKSDQHAKFQVDVDVSEGEPCAASGEVIQLRLEVTDENGTALRHSTPLRLEVVQDPRDPDVSDEELRPGQVLQAEGDQFIQYLFATHDGFPTPESGEGVVLTRTDQTHALEPFTTLNLNGHGTRLGDDTHSWTPIDPVYPDQDAFRENITYSEEENRDRIIATDNVTGALMDEVQRNGESQPDMIGTVSMYGWGDGSTIEWREGWNPLVLNVTDNNGDPIEEGVSEDRFELDFKVVVRDEEDTIQETYHLSTNDDTILLRNLGGGYLHVDLYLPEGLNGTTLGDYPFDGSAGVEMEAWALHFEIDRNVESTTGQGLSGDAYWRLSDLGMRDPDSAEIDEDDLKGTWGPSLIGPTDPTDFTTHTLEEDPDREQIERLHFISMIRGGPSDPSGAWETGPGIHDYSMFALHEDDEERSSSLTLNEEETDEDVRVHEFRPYSGLEPRVSITPQERTKAPGKGSFLLEENATVEGMYSTFFGLPDTGTPTFKWISQLDVREDGLTLEKTTPLPIEQQQTRQAPAGAFPMPFAVDDDRLFQTEDALEGRNLFDTRVLPGFLPDRGDFGIAARATESGGIHMALTEQTLFTVEGEGLLTIDTSNLPTVGEQERPIRLTGDRAISPTPASAVQDVDIELRFNGNVVDEATLTDDGTNSWTGQVTPESIGIHRLVIRATDTAGGLTTVGVNVDVDETQPPEIDIEAPDLVDGYRAMTPSGTIEATVLDRNVRAEDITFEERIGADDDADPQPLEEGNVSISGVLDHTSPIDDRDITLSLTNVSEGRAWVNVTGNADGFSNIQGTDITANGDDGTVEGNLTFNETGTATLTVETSGDDGISETLTVTVEDDDGDGFNTVNIQDAISCEGAVCEISHAPSGLSDGDLYQFRISVEVGDDLSQSDITDVIIDDTAPTVTIELADGEHVDGNPPVVGPSTTVMVTAEDDVPAGVDDGLITNLVLSAIQDDTETGSTTLSGNDGQATLSQLGATGDGEVTLRANATNLAGIETGETLTVTIDGSGPSIQTPSLEAISSNVDVSVDVTDDAGVDRVRIFHKGPGSTTFTSESLSHDAGDTYTGTLDDACSNTGILEYYVTARDAFDNDAELRGESNPFTVNLSEICPEDLTVSIQEPDDGATVTGTVDIVIDTFSPDGLDTTLTDLTLELADGSTVELDVEDPTAEAFAWDTTTVDDGTVTISATVTDDIQTATDSITVTVENTLQIDGGACEGIEELTVGEGIELCFTYPTSANVTHLDVGLYKDGDAVDVIEDLEPQPDGEYSVTFDIEEAGDYELVIIAYMDDGSTEEASTGTFGVASIADVVAPIGRFITTLILGVAVAGLAAFAAFGRWN